MRTTALTNRLRRTRADLDRTQDRLDAAGYGGVEAADTRQYLERSRRIKEALRLLAAAEDEINALFMPILY